MKKRNFCILIWILTCACLLQGCIQLPDTPSDETTGEGDDLKKLHYYPDAVYDYASLVDVTLLLTELDPTYLILASKVHVLGDSYVPASLKTLTCATNNGKTIQLEARAADAVCAMMKEMNAEGIKNISVTSGYRDYAYQSSLFSYYCEQETKGFSEEARAYFGDEYLQNNYHDFGLTGLTPEDARRVVLTYSAYPGTSEHQTGLCVDFITSDMSGLTNAFENTAASAWLRENAYKFGFILRYPADKTDVTGYSYESWHYRFVGREAATDIHFGRLTLEQYLIALETFGN